MRSKRIISIIPILLFVLAPWAPLKSSSASQEYTFWSEASLDDQHPAYIYVYNRSPDPVQVYFNGNYAGGLGPGQYFTWTVPAGNCYHIRSYWPNGEYYYWDTCLGPNQTQQCII